MLEEQVQSKVDWICDVRWIYSGDYRAGVTLCSIPNQTGKPRIADGTLADRETPYRRWYFGLSHGRVGRRQNKSSLLHEVLTKCNFDIKTEFYRPRGGFFFFIFYFL